MRRRKTCAPTYRTYDEQNRLVGLRTYRGLAHGTQPVDGTGGYDLTTWNYHSQRGWLVSKRDAANLGADYTYTPAARLETRKWARTVGGGARLTTAYTYDAGKLTGTTYNDGVTQAAGYSYDSFGRQTEVVQGGNSWVYAYDPATLQLTTETVTYDTDFNGTGDFTRVLSRSHDSRLRPTGYQLKDGATIEAQVAYTYDDASRLQTVGDGTDTFTYGYQPESHLVQTVTGPVHTVTNTWDTNRNALLANRIKSRTGTATDSGGVLTDYTANALNHYTAINAATPSHDVDGNQLTGPLPNDPAHVLGATWDGENRMTEAKNDGSTVGNYRYDPFGRRIYKNSSATGVRWFIYDGWNLVSEHQVSGGVATVLRTHLWGSDLSGSMQGAGGVSGLLSTYANEMGLSGRFYPAYDGNGNVTDYLDASGSIHAYFAYDAFGAVVGSSGASTDFFFRFSTKYEDFETGMNYYGYRYYDPQQGRWLNRDLIEEDGGENLYGFLHQDGINQVDILGLIDYEPLYAAMHKAGSEAYDHANKDFKDRHDNWKKNGVKGKEPDGAFEFGGRICKICKDGKVEYIDGGRGTSNQKKYMFDSDYPPCPEGSELAGIYHNHPNDSPLSTVQEKGDMKITRDGAGANGTENLKIPPGTPISATREWGYGGQREKVTNIYNPNDKARDGRFDYSKKQ